MNFINLKKVVAVSHFNMAVEYEHLQNPIEAELQYKRANAVLRGIEENYQDSSFLKVIEESLEKVREG